MKRILALLVSLVLMQTGYSQKEQDTTNLLKVGDEMPAFTLVTLDGKTVTSDDLYGKVVLISFYASWCVPCNLGLPLVERDIWAKYKDNEDFMLLIVDLEETTELIQPYVEKMKWTMPFYLDEKKEAYLKFATKFIPRNYLFEQQSQLILHSNGFNKQDLSTLKTEIEALLKKKN